MFAKISYPDGSSYEGNQQDGLRCSYGTFRSVERFAAGNWKNDKLNGRASLTLFKSAETLIYSGEFVDDVLQGEGKFQRKRDSEIIESYAGYFLNFNYQGYGELIENKETYKGNFENGQKSGKGTLKSAGYCFEGTFANNTKMGLGVAEYPTFRISGYWFNDSKLGEFAYKSTTHSGKLVFNRQEELAKELTIAKAECFQTILPVFQLEARGKGMQEILTLYKKIIKQFVVGQEDDSEEEIEILDPYNADYAQIFDPIYQQEIKSLTYYFETKLANIEFSSGVRYQGQAELKFDWQDAQNAKVIFCGEGKLSIPEEQIEAIGTFNGGIPNKVQIKLFSDAENVQIIDTEYKDLNLVNGYKYESSQTSYFSSFSEQGENFTFSQKSSGIEISGTAIKDVIQRAKVKGSNAVFDLQLQNGQVCGQRIAFQQLGEYKDCVAHYNSQIIDSLEVGDVVKYKCECQPQLRNQQREFTEFLRKQIDVVDQTSRQYNDFPQSLSKQVIVMRKFLQEEILLVCQSIQYKDGQFYVGELKQLKFNGKGYNQQSETEQLFGIFENHVLKMGFIRISEQISFGFFEDDGNLNNGIQFIFGLDSITCMLYHNKTVLLRCCFEPDYHFIQMKEKVSCYIQNSLFTEIITQQLTSGIIESFTVSDKQCFFDLQQVVMYWQRDLANQTQALQSHILDVQNYQNNITDLQQLMVEVYNYVCTYIFKINSVVNILQNCIYHIASVLHFDIDKNNFLSINSTQVFEDYKLTLYSNISSQQLTSEALHFQLSQKLLGEENCICKIITPVKDSEFCGQVFIQLLKVVIATSISADNFVGDTQIEFLDDLILKKCNTKIITEMKESYFNGIYQIYQEQKQLFNGTIINNQISAEGNYVDDVLQYKGSYENGLFHGVGILTVLSNDEVHEYQGQFYQGLKHGKGHLTISRGGQQIRIFSALFVKDYIEDENGECVDLENGFTFHGQIKDGQLAHGQVAYRNGNLYNGQMFDFMIHGSGELQDVDKRVTISGEFRNGVPHGVITITFDPLEIQKLRIANKQFEIQSIAGLFDEQFVGQVEVSGRQSEHVSASSVTLQDGDYVVSGQVNFEISALQFQGEIEKNEPNPSVIIGRLHVQVADAEEIVICGGFSERFEPLITVADCENFGSIENLEFVPPELGAVSLVLALVPSQIFDNILKIQGDFQNQGQFQVQLSNSDELLMNVGSGKLVGTSVYRYRDGRTAQLHYQEGKNGETFVAKVEAFEEEFTGIADFLTYKSGTLKNKSGVFRGSFKNNQLSGDGVCEYVNFRPLSDILKQISDFAAGIGVFLFLENTFIFRGVFENNRPKSGVLTQSGVEMAVRLELAKIQDKECEIYAVDMFKSAELMVTNVFCLKNLHTQVGTRSLVRCEGIELEGTIKNSKFIEGKIVTPDYQFEGQCINLQLIDGKKTTKTGIYKGTFDLLNQFEGEGVFQNQNTKEKYVGQWAKGKYHGIGILRDTNGTTYQGNFQNSKFSSGKIMYADGKIVDI